jgi:outer membrane protein OmpA-like peptidoglycan-associated protein/tetratricopeptide (TPR) repeat protein
MSLLLYVLLYGIVYGQKATLSKAESLLSAGKWPEAIEIFEEAVKNDEKNLSLRYEYGKALLTFGDYKKSLSHLDFVYKIKSNHAKDLGFLRAKALHLSGKHAEAAAAFRLLKNEISPTHPEYRYIDRLIGQCRRAESMAKTPQNASIENLSINCPYSDFAPVIATDNSVIYFTSSRPGAVEDKLSKPPVYREDVYRSFIINGEYSSAENVGTPINSAELDASIGLSADGNTLYIYRSIGSQGDVYISQLTAKGWENPQALSQINTNYWEPSVCEAVGGKVLIYSSEKPGGLGGRDLYIAGLRGDGSWYTRNLGPEINTPYNEDAPFLHPDGRTLYFSSDGHSTIGGFDIFKSVLQSDGSWSKPENLGIPINSPADDIYFTLAADGITAYLSSTRQGGKGLKDIYKAILSQQNNNAAAQLTPLLKGRVVDAESNTLIDKSRIMIIDNETKDTIFSKKTPGNFILPLHTNRNYNISISAENYLFHSENIVINDTIYPENRSVTIKLSKIKPGSKTTLNNVFFDFDKSTLRKESYIELDGLAKLLRENPTLIVGIYGHTDNKGGKEYNQKLSQERAESVVNYLIKNGISAQRLEAKGFGETQPVAGNETSEDRQKNRRTELVILSN